MTESPARNPQSPFRLGPEGGLVHLYVLDTHVQLRLRADSQVTQVATDWSRCLVSVSQSGTSDEGMLVVDSQLPLTQEMRHRLVANLTERGIDDLAGRALMLHAAGVASKDGRVLALVAESGTGKTTAAHHLCRGSFGYVTDETVAVTPEGGVFPFAKPLSLVTDPDQPQVKQHQGPDALGLKLAPDAPLTLAGVVLLARDPDHAGAPALEDVPLLDALMELICHTSAFTWLDHPLQQAARIVGRCGPVRRLTYRDIHDCDVLLEDLVAADPGQVEAWCSMTIEPPAADERPPEGAFVALMPDDLIQGGDAALALVGRVPVHLGPLALTVWLAISGGATSETLHRIVINEHGSHPDAESIVRATVDGLARAGLLRSAIP